MLEVIDHETRLAFSGEPAAALDVAATALLGHGFEIVEQSERELRALGPGMSSTNQPALVGASEIAVLVGRSEVVVRARLGGVRRMKIFLWLFPPGLGLFLIATFAVTGVARSWTPLLAVAPWVILGPLLSSRVERRTTAAVDRLARSMVQASGRAR